MVSTSRRVWPMFWYSRLIRVRVCRRPNLVRRILPLLKRVKLSQKVRVWKSRRRIPRLLSLTSNPSSQTLRSLLVATRLKRVKMVNPLKTLLVQRFPTFLGNRSSSNMKRTKLQALLTFPSFLIMSRAKWDRSLSLYLFKPKRWKESNLVKNSPKSNC